jgi:hypothetical protein
MKTPSDTVAEKQPPGANPKSPWQKTPYPNLIRTLQAALILAASKLTAS